ncbi:MucR family transcriptional regulator [Labrys sp. WJW]|uniref:MucR family transcriptional regulator n=1 Tax=Labrys sp. WJW TaxID=1737983 RepID=UPI000834D671|nr:MucR family transcriptional regulator [Labrys sp. WJW]OCC02162.1 MucR family transcriptional regulator [Labrys sp. WJW]
MLEADTKLVDLTVDIVSAYVANNQVSSSSLSELIRSVHGRLSDLNTGRPIEPVVAATPAVPIKKSVTPDYVICLEDGRKFKSLSRHLRSAYDMTPEQYREKWGLPADYPMVAPNYSAHRSRLAKELGLGQQGRQTKEKAPVRTARGRAKKGNA